MCPGEEAQVSASVCLAGLWCHPFLFNATYLVGAESCNFILKVSAIVIAFDIRGGS